MKYDSLDLEIIRRLQQDSRRSFADIARELSVPAGVVQARYVKMKKTGLIAGSTLVIDLSRIGINFAASIGIVAHESEVEEVKKYLEGLRIENGWINVWTAFGRYNLAMAVFLRNSREIFKITQMIKLHSAVESVEVSLGNEVSYNIQNFHLEQLLE